MSTQAHKIRKLWNLFFATGLRNPGTEAKLIPNRTRCLVLVANNLPILTPFRTKDPASSLEDVQEVRFPTSFACQDSRMWASGARANTTEIMIAPTGIKHISCKTKTQGTTMRMTRNDCACKARAVGMDSHLSVHLRDATLLHATDMHLSLDCLMLAGGALSDTWGFGTPSPHRGCGIAGLADDCTTHLYRSALRNQGPRKFRGAFDGGGGGAGEGSSLNVMSNSH